MEKFAQPTILDTITSEQSQAALLNILDDMEESKQWLGDQRSATLNMMEDLVEQQNELKASRKQFQDLNSMLIALTTKTSTKGALDFLAWSLRTIARFRKVVILVPASNKDLKVVSSAGFPKDWPLEKVVVSLKEKNKLFAHSYFTGKFFAVDNVRSAGVRIDKEIIEMLTLTSVLIMPLSMGTEEKSLIIADRGELLAFSLEEKAVFQTFNSQAEAVLTKIHLVDILKTQKEKLEALDKAKSEFLSTASHQLRTPLSTMRWSFETLLEEDLGKLTKEQKEHLQETYEANQRLIRIVNDLLNVSRIEMGRVKQEPKLLKIETVIEKVIAEQAQPAKEQKVTLSFKKPKASLPEIFVDKEHLRAVLENLISNAIRYNKPKGRVDVEVSLERPKALVKIADTGLGIPKAQQKRVFTKFFRGENVTRKEKGGTGLGLHIAKSYIETWGGKMWFESEEDKGSTFFFTVPIAKDETKKNKSFLSS